MELPPIQGYYALVRGDPLVIPEGYCGQFVVLRIATTQNNAGKKFWGCPNYKVKFIQLGFKQT